MGLSTSAARSVYGESRGVTAYSNLGRDAREPSMRSMLLREPTSIVRRSIKGTGISQIQESDSAGKYKDEVN